MKSALMAFRKLLRLLLVFLAFIATCGIPAASNAESDGDPQHEPGVIRMGSIFDTMPGVDTEDARMAMEMLMRNIVVRNGGRFHIQLDFLMEVDHAAEKIRAERYDLVVLPGLDYLRIKDKVALSPRMVLSRVNSPTEPLVLVSQRGQTMKSLAARNKRTLIIDVGRSGEIAKLWLETVLLEAGLGPIHQFFTEIRLSQKSSRSVLPVFFGQVAACVVPENALNVMIELNPQIGQKVQVLKRSENLVTLLLCATSWADQEDVDRVVEEGINAFDDPKSRQALTIVQMHRFFLFQPEYMAGTVELYDHFQHTRDKRGR